MRLQKAPLLAATATVFLLAACGGGGGPKVLGPGRTVTPAASDVFALSNTTADATSRIGGVTLASESNTIRIVTAQLPHQIGNLQSFSSGPINISDLDDSASGGWSDGNGNTLTTSPAQQGNYTYAGLFNFTSIQDGASGPTIVGVLTPSSGFPATGTVIYRGEAFVDGATDNRNTPFSARGVSTITSDFTGTGGNIGVVISGLENSPPFDRIEISSMPLTRSSATFAGGSVTLYVTDVDVLTDVDVTADILGAGYTTDASGAFYGLDSLVEDFQPDEVGGIFVGDGTNGTLSGGFLAD